MGTEGLSVRERGEVAGGGVGLSRGIWAARMRGRCAVGVRRGEVFIVKAVLA
jgi:hypothetical protein